MRLLDFWTYQSEISVAAVRLGRDRTAILRLRGSVHLHAMILVDKPYMTIDGYWLRPWTWHRRAHGGEVYDIENPPKKGFLFQITELT